MSRMIHIGVVAIGIAMMIAGCKSPEPVPGETGEVYPAPVESQPEAYVEAEAEVAAEPDSNVVEEAPEAEGLCGDWVEVSNESFEDFPTQQLLDDPDIWFGDCLITHDASQSNWETKLIASPILEDQRRAFLLEGRTQDPELREIDTTWRYQVVFSKGSLEQIEYIP